MPIGHFSENLRSTLGLRVPQKSMDVELLSVVRVYQTGSISDCKGKEGSRDCRTRGDNGVASAMLPCLRLFIEHTSCTFMYNLGIISYDDKCA